MYGFYLHHWSILQTGQDEAKQSLPLDEPFAVVWKKRATGFSLSCSDIGVVVNKRQAAVVCFLLYLSNR